MFACVNGKWLAQPASGTQRYATQVMSAISRTAAAPQITLILPKDAELPQWGETFRVKRSRLRGMMFEQIALPWLSRGMHLYSLAGPAPMLKRAQTVVMHDAMPFRFPGTFRLSFVAFYRLMYFLLARTANRVCTVSEFSRGELAAVLRVAETRFTVAPCGADHADPAMIDAHPGLPFPAGRFALIVGNLAPHKNVNAAATALADAEVPLVVVGAAQQIFRGAELEERSSVKFVGRVNDHELAQLYQAAGVLVAPSRYEGFGIPIIEAGKYGCPTVFATGSAMTEVAGDGGIGFDPQNMGDCVDAVRRILADNGLRTDLSARARTNAERYSWTTTAQTLFGPHLRAGDGTESTFRPLRVLHITETFSAGTGSAIVGYAMAIRGQGVESHLLAQDRDSGLFDELTDSPFVSARIVPQGLFNLWRAIGPVVAEIRPDIVHLHSSKAGGIGRLQGKLAGNPRIVYSPHCFGFERRDISKNAIRVIRFIESLLARRTDAYICVSPHEAELTRQLSAEPDVHLVLNTLALSVPAIRPATDTAATATTPRLVTVGRIAPQKNPGLFLEIVEKLRVGGRVDATWVGDGDGPDRMGVVGADVEVTGWLPVAQVASAMQGHTAYVHTAGWEAAVPIAVLDAMAAGLPVVVRRNPAYASLLPDEWQFDDAAGAVEMIRGFSDETTRRRRIRAQFATLDQIAQGGPGNVLADIYRSAADRETVPAPVLVSA